MENQVNSSKQDGYPNLRKGGGGRIKGSKNRKTIAREALAAATAELLAKQLVSPEVAEMSPLTIILNIARISFQSGNIETAMKAAEIAMPYTHEKLAAKIGDGAVPDALRADEIDDEVGDEAGPDCPVV